MGVIILLVYNKVGVNARVPFFHSLGGMNVPAYAVDLIVRKRMCVRMCSVYH